MAYEDWLQALTASGAAPMIAGMQRSGQAMVGPEITATVPAFNPQFGPPSPQFAPPLPPMAQGAVAALAQLVDPNRRLGQQFAPPPGPSLAQQSLGVVPPLGGPDLSVDRDGLLPWLPPEILDSLGRSGATQDLGRIVAMLFAPVDATRFQTLPWLTGIPRSTRPSPPVRTLPWRTGLPYPAASAPIRWTYPWRTGIPRPAAP